MKYLILIALIGCNVRPRVTELMKLSDNQKEYLAKSSLEIRAYMDSCLDSEYDSFDNCLKKYKEMGVVQKESGSSVLKTAAGVALCYGAAKLILSK